MADAPVTSTTSVAPGRSNTAFVTHFMPGLIIGLLVGGLAGAFLPVLLERNSIPMNSAAPAPSQKSREQRERDELPQDPAPLIPEGEQVPEDSTVPAPTSTPTTAPVTPPPAADRPKTPGLP